MRKIILLCGAGMSTSLLVKKIEMEAKRIKYDCTIEAHPVSEEEKYITSADITLLGPQIRYELNKLKNKYPNKIIEIIDMRMYGMLDGENILKLIKKKLND